MMNILLQKQLILKNRQKPNSLYIREITGRWPSEYQYVPGLRGMLHDLNQ